MASWRRILTSGWRISSLDLDQLAADLESGTVNRAPAGGGSRVWKRSSSSNGQRLADLGKKPGGFQDNGQRYD